MGYEGVLYCYLMSQFSLKVTIFLVVFFFICFDFSEHVSLVFVIQMTLFYCSLPDTI